MNHDGVTEKGIDSTFHAVTQHIFGENLINRVRRGGLNFYALWSHLKKNIHNIQIKDIRLTYFSSTGEYQHFVPPKMYLPKLLKL